jgi:hypothetical protein
VVLRGEGGRLFGIVVDRIVAMLGQAAQAMAQIAAPRFCGCGFRV